MTKRERLIIFYQRFHPLSVCLLNIIYGKKGGPDIYVEFLKSREAGRCALSISDMCGNMIERLPEPDGPAAELDYTPELGNNIKYLARFAGISELEFVTRVCQPVVTVCDLIRAGGLAAAMEKSAREWERFSTEMMMRRAVLELSGMFMSKDDILLHIGAWQSTRSAESIKKNYKTMEL